MKIRTSLEVLHSDGCIHSTLTIFMIMDALLVNSGPDQNQEAEEADRLSGIGTRAELIRTMQVSL